MSLEPAPAPPTTSSPATGGNRATEPARRHRLSIAVLIDYANFMGGGYESHLRKAFDAKCRRDGHTLLILYGAPLDSPHLLGKADNAIFDALRPESFDAIIAASSSLTSYSGPERLRRLLDGLRPAAPCSRLPWLTKPYAVDALARIVEQSLAGDLHRGQPRF